MECFDDAISSVEYDDLLDIIDTRAPHDQQDMLTAASLVTFETPKSETTEAPNELRVLVDKVYALVSSNVQDKDINRVCSEIVAHRDLVTLAPGCLTIFRSLKG